MIADAKNFARNTFLAGVFAAIPLVVTVFVLWYVDHLTRDPLKEWVGLDVPFAGVALALVGIFALGLLVRSLIGRYLLAAIDRLLLRVPVLAELYKAWKQISLTPGGSSGIYSKVVLVRLDGDAWHLAFTSGEPIGAGTDAVCVFVPTTPNPMVGRVLFVPLSRCRPTSLAVDEVFKFLLSGGNYVPEEVAVATRGEAVASPPPLVPGA
ncbi:DUF502 domain-containing protein [Nannocystis bainbridge]|uniref:DUF502 domain-containing protein n=1 Tax=Nannocystis bainbridge TaxID=2995303 RepID=A0ABT5DQW3_9BACT|nr:DUF502 domain-containing protein [Nannocystis bainbridge]MDC0715941.1 DUF502 domain-containing protein [Nannocystis bainbridge]